MKRLEQEFQKQLVGWLRMTLPPGSIVWHTPNGGARTKAEAAILKGMGVLAGFPDVGILSPIPLRAEPLDMAPGYGVMALGYWLGLIECKLPGEGLSASQKELHPKIHALSAPLAICTTLLEAQDFLDANKIPIRARTW